MSAVSGIRKSDVRVRDAGETNPSKITSQTEAATYFPQFRKKAGSGKKVFPLPGCPLGPISLISPRALHYHSILPKNLLPYVAP
jgi:hypothetical protein